MAIPSRCGWYCSIPSAEETVPGRRRVEKRYFTDRKSCNVIGFKLKGMTDSWGHYSWSWSILVNYRVPAKFVSPYTKPAEGESTSRGVIIVISLLSGERWFAFWWLQLHQQGMIKIIHVISDLSLMKKCIA